MNQQEAIQRATVWAQQADQLAARAKGGSGNAPDPSAVPAAAAYAQVSLAFSALAEHLDVEPG